MYRVVLSPAAERQLLRLRGPQLTALRGIILALADDPRPAGVRKLAGSQDTWRVRLRIDGEPWRIVYQVRDRDPIILVTRVARRDEAIYRRL